MNIKINYVTDKGITKDINQDALLIKTAHTKQNERIVFAVLCDGMGGLERGEVASGMLVNRLSAWFDNELPLILTDENITQRLDRKKEVDILDLIKKKLYVIAMEMNYRIEDFGKEKNTSLGTTIICLFVMQNKYFVMNVGDSRVYINEKKIRQITHDHSYVQREVDLGHMTEKEAMESPQRSMLLQCIGASETLSPDFFGGEIKKASFLLCSDGFWRQTNPNELKKLIENASTMNEADANIVLSHFVRELEKRGESDNISAILVHVE